MIFDLDETMIHGDCSSLWSQRMASLGWVDESLRPPRRQLMEQYAEERSCPWTCTWTTPCNR
ncbi:hypothetical protein P4056_15185 [Pseudomonas aeruginosa]|nr:hypothetical protein [Pseudomonas aeruginosa]